MRTRTIGVGFAASMVLFAASSHAAGPYPSDVAATSLGHGTRLTDADGFTLYRFDNDLREPGTSVCTGECAEQRPPLLVAEIPAEIPENWGLIERDDGTRQWAYAGRPLYRYVRDEHKGSAYGEGDGWTVAFDPLTTPPDMSITGTVLGHVLAATNGVTLYVQDASSAPSECTGVCMETWAPLEAPWGASNYGDFSVIARNDGMYQWAYQNKPLHRYMGDAERGDITGDGVDGIWRAMVLEPAPPRPSWVTIIGSDGGTLYADANGSTLHMLMEDRNWQPLTVQGGNSCDEACLKKYWTPVTAASQVPPVGFWSVIEAKDGSLQWAHKGMPLYTLKIETGPGQELFYTTFRQFQWMKPIMHKLPSLQGVF